jgi:hypothetical protein
MRSPISRNAWEPLRALRLPAGSTVGEFFERLSRGYRLSSKDRLGVG